MPIKRPFEAENRRLAKNLALLKEMAGVDSKKFKAVMGLSRPAYHSLTTFKYAMTATRLHNLATKVGMRMEDFFKPEKEFKVAFINKDLSLEKQTRNLAAEMWEHLKDELAKRHPGGKNVSNRD